MKEVFDTDQKLWTALRLDNAQAIRHIYSQYFHIWLSWMTTRGGHRADGEDIFQEAVLVLINKSKDTEFKLTAQVNTLLMTICKRMWYKKLERQPSTVELDTEQDNQVEFGQEIIEEQEQKEQLFKRMNEALRKLGEPCASILKSYYIDQKSMLDIAVEFNYTNADNAKNQKYKCMNRLKKLFFNN